MFALRLLWWVLASSPAAFAQQRTHVNSTEFRGLLYEKKGNVSLTGLFGRPFGNECSSETERGLEEIISAIWTIEALNTYEYFPGITIGLTVLDVCEASEGEKATLYKMEEGLSRFNKEAANIGIIATLEITGKQSTSESIPDSDVVRMKHIISSDMLNEITLQLLLNLQWMNVTILVFDSERGMNSFTAKGMTEGIFIQNSVLVNCRNSCLEVENFSEKFKTSTVTVVVASFDNIVRLSEKFHNKDMKLILTPTDFVFNSNSLDLPRNTIICLPSMQDKRVLAGVLDNIQRRRDFFSRKPPVKGPLFLGTATTIITFLKPLKRALEEKCRNESLSEQPCVPLGDFIAEIKGNKTRLLSHKTMEISSDDVEEALKVLKVEPSSNDEMFLYIASVINANVSEDLAIFQIFNPRLKTFQPAPIMINDDLLRTDEAEKDLFAHENMQMVTRRRNPSVSLLQELSGNLGGGLQPPSGGSPLDRNCDNQDVHCPQNSERNLTATLTTTNGTGTGAPGVSWRFLTWVSVNTSLGFVGVTCTLSIMLFVVIKICKDDFLEGSPYFTLFLMISVVFTYLSSFPFHIEFLEEGFMCGYRKCVPPVIFAVLFSLLLSRSLMIAFTETGGGLSGSINGYLQSILSVFMIGVQASITLQNWILATGVQDLTCADIYNKYNIIFTLVYDVLLVFLLACTSPFIVRSKRNCKEGLLFSISVFFIAIVWSAWISFYVLLPKEHKDAAVAVGLNSTASVLLLCVFIPQMYFMASPFPQDQTICSLSALDRNALAGGSHANFKSSHALNECAFGSYKNCEMGCVNPSFLVSRPNGSNALDATDNFAGGHGCDRTPKDLNPTEI